MKSFSKWAVFALLTLVVVGCGKDQAVMVGNPSEKGLIRESTDVAKEIGAKADEREKSNERELYGG